MSNVYRNGMVHVRGEQCDRCLLGSARLVSGERARQIIRDTRGADGATFVCHKGQVSDEGDAICRVWFNLFADEDWLLRLAKAEGKIVFTTPPKES